MKDIKENNMTPEEKKELLRLASLVGTDAKAPEEKLLNFISQIFQQREKELLERIKEEVMILQAEKPSVYSSEDGQNAVYDITTSVIEALYLIKNK